MPRAIPFVVDIRVITCMCVLAAIQCLSNTVPLLEYFMSE